VYEASLADAIFDVFSAARDQSPPSVRSASSSALDLRSLNVSLRDEAAADDVSRFVVATLAAIRTSLRLTVRAFQRRGLMPKVYIPVQTLAPRVVLQLRSHLVLQNSIKNIVGSSVTAGGDAASLRYDIPRGRGSSECAR